MGEVDNIKRKKTAGWVGGRQPANIKSGRLNLTRQRLACGCFVPDLTGLTRVPSKPAFRAGQ